jgi:peptidoglycan/xylan/chitin deacetylase (PgdA/CDA1 family)
VLGGALGALVVAGVALWYAPRWLVPIIAARSPGCLYFVHATKPVVALTIDDGPDPRSTAGILAVLARHGAHATFFLISGRIPGREEVVSAIVRGGHEIGNHLTRDEPSIRLAPARFEAALVEADAVLSRFAPVAWVRPGSGWYNGAMLAAIARHRYRCALGSVYPYDPHLPWSGFAAAYVLAHVRPGAVIVLHDGGARGERTAATLERVLPVLARHGYRVVSLSELAGSPRV